jgi:fructose-1,6-bisphosphatase
MRAEAHVDMHVKSALFLSDFNQTGMRRQIVVKLRSIEYYENPFSGSRTVLCLVTEMEKLIRRSFVTRERREKKNADINAIHYIYYGKGVSMRMRQKFGSYCLQNTSQHRDKYKYFNALRENFLFFILRT